VCIKPNKYCAFVCPCAAQVRSGIQPRTVPKNASRSGIYGWWQLVYRDLITIGDQLGGIPKGHRDIYLFLYCVALSWFADVQALEGEAYLVAKKIMPELKSGEVRKAIDPNVKRAIAAGEGKTVIWNGIEKDPRYWYKRETILDLLQDVIPPDMTLDLRALVPTEVLKARKEERDGARYEDGYTKAGVKVSNLEKADQARAMRADGGSFRKIANALDVSVGVVHKWCSST
jgi:hypothetical protein